MENSRRDVKTEAMGMEKHFEKCENFDEGNNSCTGRWYECTFCKRGFNNAQALGGHMNIHRKDKAKVKKKCNKAKEEHMGSTNGTCMYYEPIYSIDQMNHQFYFSKSNPSNPSFAPEYYRSDSNSHEQNLLGTNLSLQIRSYCTEDRSSEGKKRDENVMQNELDLELRLGYDP